MFYHNFCRNTDQNSRTSKKSKEKEKTAGHRTREARSAAYVEVCRFISEEIVEMNKSYFSRL